MKKIILILTTLCLTFAYSFAQNAGLTMDEMLDTMDMSAKKRATAGEYSSDSDNLNAKDVFDLNRTIFSAGYVPGLNSSGNSTIQAFFGIPIMDNAMYFGIAGFYTMNETRNDYFNGNTVGNTTILPLPTDVPTMYLGKNVMSGSAFAIRPVLKINDMFSLHFLIARGGNRQAVEGYTSLDPYNSSKSYTAITNLSDASQWVYEVAAGLKFGDLKVKIPVRVTVNGDGTGAFANEYGIVKSYNDAAGSETTTITASTNRTGTGANNYPIHLSVSPEVSIPLQAGPMNTMTIALSAGGDVYGADNKSYTKSENNNKTDAGTSIDTTITETTQKDMLNMNFDLNAYPTLEWSLADGRVDLIMEPTIGLRVNVTNVGNQTSKTTTSSTGPGSTPTEEYTTITVDKTSDIETTPYVSLPIGTLFRPVEWFEFRAGLKYELGFKMNNYSIETLGGAKGKQFNYEFTSTMNLYTGMGFIVGEDFFIDLFLAAATGTRDYVNTGASGNLLSIDSWGAQLTYRL